MGGKTDEPRYPAFGSALRAAMEKEGLEIRDLCKPLGVGYEMARRYYHGIAIPRNDKINKLARLVKMPAARLLSLEAAEPSMQYVIGREAGEQPPDDFVFVKESRLNVSAGPGHELAYELIEDSEPATYRASWLRARGVDPKRARRFRVSGNSMKPFLFDGDTVLINTAATDITDGKIYAVRFGNKLLIKRVSQRIDGSIVLTSENPEYRPEVIEPATAEAEQFAVIGKYVERSGSGGE